MLRGGMDCSILFLIQLADFRVCVATHAWAFFVAHGKVPVIVDSSICPSRVRDGRYKE